MHNWLHCSVPRGSIRSTQVFIFTQNLPLYQGIFCLSSKLLLQWGHSLTEARYISSWTQFTWRGRRKIQSLENKLLIMSSGRRQRGKDEKKFGRGIVKVSKSSAFLTTRRADSRKMERCTKNMFLLCWTAAFSWHLMLSPTCAIAVSVASDFGWGFENT